MEIKTMTKSNDVDGKSDKSRVEKSSTSETDGKVHKEKLVQNVHFESYC